MLLNFHDVAWNVQYVLPMGRTGADREKAPDNNSIHYFHNEIVSITHTRAPHAAYKPIKWNGFFIV